MQSCCIKSVFFGQDGRGAYRHPFVGDVDEFAIWTRTLSHEEVRRIYEAGLAGKEFLADNSAARYPCLSGKALSPDGREHALVGACGKIW